MGCCFTRFDHCETEFGFVSTMLSSFVRRLFGSGASGDAPASRMRDSYFESPPIEVVEHAIYEIQPAPQNPKVEIVFFHEFELGDYRDAYWEDWLSADRKHCWLGSWLVEEFREARILMVRYDSSLTHTPTDGRVDLTVIARNLVSTLIRFGGRVGQRSCPVILVGHGLGGLVMKKLMVTVDSFYSDSHEVVLETFLNRVRGLFFYATPHTGSRLAETIRKPESSPLLENLKVFGTETVSLHEQFMALRRSLYKWSLSGLGETLETKLGENFYGLVVEQVSAQGGMQWFTMVDADHIDICKPRAKTSTSFLSLTDFIRDVIKQDAESGQQCDGLPKYSVDLEHRARALEEKWNLMKDGMVGIIGMGGIGKTTLAIKLFNSISRNFEYTCFINNVKGFPSHELEDRIFSQLYLNGRKLGGKGESLSWKDVMSKSVLIVMDDVDSVKHLNVLPSELRNFAAGRRVLFTSRIQLGQAYKYFEVEFLEEDDATRLFCQHAFDSNDIPERLQGKVQEVVTKCGGLPLSLEVVGSCLRDYGQDPKIWEGVLEKVRRAQPPDGEDKDRLFWALQLSYNGLAPEEKRMFLDVATSFFEERLDVALAALSSSFVNSEVSWKNLVRRCLVKEITKTEDISGWLSYDTFSEGGVEFKNVWMHEHLRDLGKKLKKMSSTSGSEDDANKVNDILDSNMELCTEYDIADLMRCGVSGRTEVLRLKSLRNPLKYVSFAPHPHHKGSSADFPGNLVLLQWKRQMGKWNESEPHFPASLHGGGKLAVLELENWRLSGGQMEELGNHTNLQILTLKSNSRDHLPAPESIGKLIQLRRLTLEVAVAGLPRAFGDLSLLEYLSLESSALTHLPDSFSSLFSLKTLFFFCSNLTRLPRLFGSLPQLETLLFGKCHELANLPNSFGSLSSLACLSFQKCENLTHLPNSFGSLSSLARLSFKECRNLTHLPASFGSLSSLARLSFNECGSLAHMPDSFGSLSSLARLGFKECGNLTQLPASFGSLSSLASLSFFECWNLTHLPDSFGSLSSLASLSFFKCWNLTHLPDSFGSLSALANLSFRSCWDLTDLPDSFGSLSSLTSFRIERSKNLTHLPDSFGSLSSLASLKFYKCENLTHLPDSFGSLSSLASLSFYKCGNLTHLPDSFGSLSSLVSLDFRICPNLQHLPDSFGTLLSLDSLCFEECRNLTHLPDSFGSLSSLANLRFNKCKNLTHLPASFGSLSSLVGLNFFGSLSSLVGLNFFHCGNLIRLPDSFGSLSSLELLDFIDCPALEMLSVSSSLLPTTLSDGFFWGGDDVICRCRSPDLQLGWDDISTDVPGVDFDSLMQLCQLSARLVEAMEEDFY